MMTEVNKGGIGTFILGMEERGVLYVCVTLCKAFI